MSASSDSVSFDAPKRATLILDPRHGGTAGTRSRVVRVLAVDDHAVLIEGLRAHFALDGRVQIVGQLPSAERLLEEVARYQPDVVLLDIELPGPDAFEMADRLRHMHPKVRCVFLSAHVRDGYLSAAYRCGAWGYFAKGDDLAAIVEGIREVATSDSETFVMGPKVRERCGVSGAAPSGHVGEANGVNTSTHSPVVTALDSLTNRELEVLRLIGKGFSRCQIAKQLSRSVKTVDGHQERLMKKLSLESRADLMRFAIREGLAEA